MTSMDKYERELFEVAEYNKAIYDRNLKEQAEEYKTTTTDFLKWVEEIGEMDNLKHQLHTLRRGMNEVYGIAIEFSIPVIMVKKLSTMAF